MENICQTAPKVPEKITTRREWLKTNGRYHDIYSRDEVISLLMQQRREDKVVHQEEDCYWKKRAVHNEAFVNTLAKVIKGEAPLSDLSTQPPIHTVTFDMAEVERRAVSATPEGWPTNFDGFAYLSLSGNRMQFVRTRDFTFDRNHIYIGKNISDRKVMEVLKRGILTG